MCDKILFLKKALLNGNPFAVTFAVFQRWTDGINAIHQPLTEYMGIIRFGDFIFLFSSFGGSGVFLLVKADNGSNTQNKLWASSLHPED